MKPEDLWKFLEGDEFRHDLCLPDCRNYEKEAEELKEWLARFNICKK